MIWSQSVECWEAYATRSSSGSSKKRSMSGMLTRSEANIAPEQGMVHFGFIVEPTQFDAALQTIEAKATPIVSGPGTRDQGRYVFISDPDGYTVELFECLLPPYEAAD